MLALLSFAVSWLTAAALLRSRAALTVVDYPNSRSLHSVPVPRTGGLAIWAGAVIGSSVLLVAGSDPVGLGGAIAVAALLVGSVSLLDDLSHVSTIKRLVVHTIAAAFVVGAIPAIDALRLPGISLGMPTLLSAILAAVFVVWMINLYNFMDGIDGLAGGMAVMGFGAMGLLGYLSHHPGYAAICWIIAASSAGFLIWNFPPARIFMGDTGSSTLGLMMAVLSLWADARDIFSLWIAILIFSPFIVDASVTLLTRTLRGEHVWEAHRGHYYQRLVLAGWSHRRTTMWGYALMAVCAAGALLVRNASIKVQLGVIFLTALLHVLAAMATVRMERQRERFGRVG